MISDLKKKVEALQIDKRGVNVETKPLLDNLESANSELIGAIKSAHTAQLDISAKDPIRDRLDAILSGRVGASPKKQEDADLLVEDGERRFSEKIPPGFADSDKDKNPNDATYIHNQIKYERKFGDYIFWRQIINYTKDNDIKNLILVTGDKKEDWWWREQGKTIGPHPELIREIKGKGRSRAFLDVLFGAICGARRAVRKSDSVERIRGSAKGGSKFQAEIDVSKRQIYPRRRPSNGSTRSAKIL